MGAGALSLLSLFSLSPHSVLTLFSLFSHSLLTLFSHSLFSHSLCTHSLCSHSLLTLSKELKTKIHSHAHSLILSRLTVSSHPFLSRLTFSPHSFSSHSLNPHLCLFTLSKELKTKVCSHAHSLILSPHSLLTLSFPSLHSLSLFSPSALSLSSLSHLSHSLKGAEDQDPFS